MKRIFAQITKVDVEKREVWGQAVAEVRDRAGEIFDYASSKPHFEQWSGDIEKATDGKSLGNIRAMHGSVAAGKVIAFQPDDAAKSIDIGTKIVDDAEWKKVEEGVYTGFSIGGSYVKRWKDDTDPTLTRYTAAPVEISLVDLPCVPTAKFTMIKADGLAEDRPFQRLAVLKQLLDGTPTIGEAVALLDEYLPPEQAQALWKNNDTTMGEVVETLRKFASEAPVDETEASSAPVADAPPAETPAAVSPALPVSAPAENAPVTEPQADGADKAAEPATLKKSMYSVSRLAELLCTVSYMASDAQYELDWAKDGSTVPATLRAWLAMGVEVFRQMSAEETEKLIASVQPAEGADKAAPVELMKRADDALAKVAELTTERDTLQKRVAELEAQPEAAKGVVKVIDKKDDTSSAAAGDLEKIDPNAPDFSLQVMKAAQARPVLIGPR